MLNKFTDFTHKWVDVSGKTSPYTGEENKERLDRQAKELKEYVNGEIVDKLNSTNGATHIGTTARNGDVSTVDSELKKLQIYDFDQMVQVNANAEIIDAREGYPTLKARINTVVDQANTVVDQANTVVNNFSKDYTKVNGFATTTGTATAYAITLNPPPTAYVDGMQVTILPHIDSGATPVLNINGLGALTIVKQDGSAISIGDIKANKPLSLVRVGSNFFIRSGGGQKKEKMSSVLGTYSHHYLFTTNRYINSNMELFRLEFKYGMSPRTIAKYYHDSNDTLLKTDSLPLSLNGIVNSTSSYGDTLMFSEDVIKVFHRNSNILYCSVFDLNFNLLKTITISTIISSSYDGNFVGVDYETGKFATVDSSCNCRVYDNGTLKINMQISQNIVGSRAVFVGDSLCFFIKTNTSPNYVTILNYNNSTVQELVVSQQNWFISNNFRRNKYVEV